MSDESTGGRTLEEIGAATIRDILRKTLAEAGVSEAVGFEVVMTNGGTHSVLSEDNPILDRPASEMCSAKIKQSAEAGAVMLM